MIYPEELHALMSHPGIAADWCYDYDMLLTEAWLRSEGALPPLVAEVHGYCCRWQNGSGEAAGCEYEDGYGEGVYYGDGEGNEYGGGEADGFGFGDGDGCAGGFGDGPGNGSGRGFAAGWTVIYTAERSGVL